MTFTQKWHITSAHMRMKVRHVAMPTFKVVGNVTHCLLQEGKWNIREQPQWRADNVKLGCEFSRLSSAPVFLITIPQSEALAHSLLRKGSMLALACLAGSQSGWSLTRCSQFEGHDMRGHGPLGVKDGRSWHSVATLWNVSLHFFLSNVLTSMNYFFLFKLYLGVDSGLSLWHCHPIFCHAFLFWRGVGLKPASRGLCMIWACPRVCVHICTLSTIYIGCKVLDLLTWKGPRLVVSTTNSLPRFSEPAACTHDWELPIWS